MRTALLAVLLCAAAWAQPPDLLLHAPFDGTADPACARGSGLQQGGLLTFAPGLRGGAVSLTSDCLFAVPGNFDPRAGTLACWLRPHWSGTDPTGHYVFCLYGRRDQPEPWAHNRFSVHCVGGQCYFSVYPQAPGASVGIGGSIRAWRADEWHHVAVTWSNINSGQANAELHLYLDGIPAGALTGKQIRVGPTDEVMALGRDQDGSPDYGEADLDDVFIYSRALTAEEIAAGAQQARALPYDVASQTPAARGVPDWWNAGWPYRVEALLRPTEARRRDVFVECHLRPDLAGLGQAGAVDMTSVRVVADNASGAPAHPVLPARIEDDLVQWQVPGVIPAGSARRFWLYFRAATYAFPRPLVSQRLVASATDTTAPPSVPDYATLTYGRPWDFEDGSLCGIDQWGNKPEFLRNRKVEKGILSFDVTQDPWFIWGDMWGQVDATHQKVAIDLDQFPVLEMKVRQSVPSAKWQLYGRVGNSSSLLSHSFFVSGSAWQRVRVDLRHDAHWRGVLSALRIDPTQGVQDAHIEIDYVRLLAVTLAEQKAVETIGHPSGTPEQITMRLPAWPHLTVVAGSSQDVTVTVRDRAGRPVSGQPIRVGLTDVRGGTIDAAASHPSLAITPQSRRGLTDNDGKLTVRYTANRHATDIADTLYAWREFYEGDAFGMSHGGVPPAKLVVSTKAGPPHHYRVAPAQVVALKPDKLPLKVSAQLVDEFDNPLPGKRKLVWSTDEPARLANLTPSLDTTGKAFASWRGDERLRWVYRIRVTDDQGLTGESAAICLLPGKSRTDPIVVGDRGYFLKGKSGPVWLPLGGFYANWVGLPEGGEEGRKLVSFVDATEEQLSHWLDFLASQGVTGLRFMLRAHTKQGMEPMDVIGRVNMPLFAKVLRYMDLARKHDIRFMLTIHEDYAKPAYYNQGALETFCLPQYEGENLDALPPYQRRFIRDRKLIGVIGEKYTDPDVMACQDQYTRQLVGLLKDNPQLFAWEFENEMVDCPQSWAQHMATVIRAADPVTPICASHGGGGLNTADPLWWTKNAGVDFYTYHLYPHRGSTSAETDFGAAADVLTTYGRMAGLCMFGETAGDEFGYYPKEREADRRYIMRDLIWFSLVNGNPGCFFWNARGFEVEQFRLAGKVMATLDLSHWQRPPASVGIVVDHPWTDDKYYRTPQGQADYWMMGRLAQHYRSRGESFDFTMEPTGYPATTTLKEFKPVAGTGPCTAGPGWQVATMQDQTGQGLGYIRNFAGIREWAVPNRCDMFLRDRKPAPLVLTFALPGVKVTATATDLDTGEEKRVELAGNGKLDLGTTEHDWAVVWRTAR